MEIDKKASEAISMINTQLGEIERFIKPAVEKGDLRGGFERLERWVTRTSKLLAEQIHPDEAIKFEEKTRNAPVYRDAMRNLASRAHIYATFLVTLKEELEQYPESILSVPAAKDPPLKKNEESKEIISTNVFIVHGRDEAAKQSVARFLKHLDLNPIILHEKPDRGLIIIEKLESNSSDMDIGYAIVLLTPDDVGSLASEKDQPNPRARQNVVFELGYFIAKLGRHRVRALYSETVELPSDYQGVLYTQLDESGAWKFELAREIKATGIDIDLNRLF